MNRRFHLSTATVAAVLFVTILTGSLGFSAPARAQGAGDLVVTPTRVVFEGRERSAQVTLSNQGSAASVFRISMIAMAMDENGEMTEIEPGTQGVQTADELIRYAPRQITIPPGGAQVVRLSVRKPGGLAEGEYRSHMFFRAVPDESAGRNVADETDLQENELRIQLIPIYGITIPIIVRHGDLTVDAGLGDVSLLPAEGDVPARISVDLTRDGTSSSFGDLVAIYTPAGGGEPLVIAQVTRIAVYTPNRRRVMLMPVQMPDGVELGQGSLKIEYRQTPNDGGQLIAEKTIQIP